MGANEQVLESRIKHLELRICSDKKSFLNRMDKVCIRGVFYEIIQNTPYY